jgi:hypothetical protein
MAVFLSLAVVVTLTSFIVLTKQAQSYDYAACRGENWQDCAVSTAITHAEVAGVPEALSTLKMVLQSRPEMLNGCHEFTHLLGEAFHATFGAAAVTEDSTWCSYGYVHGVMAAAGRDNPAELTTTSLDICRRVESQVSANCTHGIGHAAMLVEDSSDEAMTYCSDLGSATLRNNCAQGVMMQLAWNNDGAGLQFDADAGTCLDFGEESLVGGCALFVAMTDVRRGLSLLEACSPYSNAGSGHYCRYGFGGGLASSHLDGFPSELATGQQAECATQASCAQGFGVSAFQFTGEYGSAVRTCERVLGNVGRDECLVGVETARSYLAGTWSEDQSRNTRPV